MNESAFEGSLILEQLARNRKQGPFLFYPL